MVPIERLKKFKVFQDAPSGLLEKLSKEMSEKTFSSGNVICKEGEPGGALYLIAEGQVSVEKKSFQGEATSKVIARLESGEFFGEMAFLQGVPHSATVTAQSDTMLLLFSRTALDELIKKDPASGLDPVLAVSMGLSNRLRSTTRELVTVFEVARAVGASGSIQDLAKQIVSQLFLDLGEKVSIAFYQWNMFNDEYATVSSEGPLKSEFPPMLESNSAAVSRLETIISIADITAAGRDLSPLSFKKGHLVLARVDMLKDRQGLFIYHALESSSFDAGERQMMETVAAVLAPALSSARHREEEEARQKLERNKQMGYSL